MLLLLLLLLLLLVLYTHAVLGGTFMSAFLGPSLATPFLRPAGLPGLGLPK